MVFKGPEVATEYGGLADAAFVDGRPVSGHVVREMARNANRQKQRGGHPLRLVYDARVTHVDSAFPGQSRQWLPPSWQSLFASSSYPVPKRHDVVKLEVRVRVVVDLDRAFVLFFGTSVNPHPATSLGDEGLFSGKGTGAEQVITMQFRCRRVEDESLRFFGRADIDPDNDPLLDTGTYGNPPNGTTDATGAGSFRPKSGGTLTWALGTQIADNGHYVVFRNAASGSFAHRPSLIVASDASNGLHFEPQAESIRVIDETLFEIRKLPSLQLISFAVREVEPQP